jgi:hypothetical protein
MRCSRCKKGTRAWYVKHRTQQLAYAKARGITLKKAAFVAYGGAVCVCCGETHFEFLTIDHIKNNGFSHRKAVGNDIYNWLKQNCYPKGYRVLCMNCNFARGLCGTCPHEKESRHGEVRRCSQRRDE